jgi:hypothetical protein
MTDDQIEADIISGISAMLKAALADEGDESALERFRDKANWYVAFDGYFYQVRWTSSDWLLRVLAPDDVAFWVGSLRALRENKQHNEGLVN